MLSLLLTSWPRNLLQKMQGCSLFKCYSLVMQLLSNNQRTKNLATELSEFSKKPNHFDDGINCIAFQVIVPEGFFFLEVEKN